MKNVKILTITLVLMCAFYASFCYGQGITIGDNKGQITFEEYEPKSTLVVPEHPLKKAKFPFIDVHNHQFEMGKPEKLKELTGEMDALNMKIMTNLSGRGFGNNAAESDKTLYGQLDNIKTNAPTRFIVFTNVDFSKIGNADFADKAT